LLFGQADTSQYTIYNYEIYKETINNADYKMWVNVYASLD